MTAPSTARAYSSASRKFSREISAVCVAQFETARIAARTAAGYGVDVKPDRFHAASADFHHRHVDAVQRGAAHHARYSH